jgi:hypothetical protein
MIIEEEHQRILKTKEEASLVVDKLKADFSRMLEN